MIHLKQAPFRTKPWICRACRTASTSLHPSRPKRRESQSLPNLPARTRFAPSPTGHLHLGSLRTALYNYLLAKATGGQFVLRIENTDTKRTIPGAEEQLCRDLRWAGLDWDEGPGIGGPYGPYRQSERTATYQTHAQRLLTSQAAYRCFCSSEKLKELAKRQNQYDGACRLIPCDQSEQRAADGEAHVIRLKVPPNHPSFTDLVYGLVGKQKLNSVDPDKLAYDDLILLKSDGLPTYHLANVVDDKQMGITHVIRAAEWMSSTPKHILLYSAFGWEPPSFAHVGLLQDIQQQKLSKRDVQAAGLDLRKFQGQGIFPEALLNYAALFGWSHERDSDVMSLEQLVQIFDLKFTKGNTVVMPEKLKFLQKKHAQRYIEERGPMFQSMVQDVSRLVQEYSQLYPETATFKGVDLRDRIMKTLQACQHNYYTPQAFYQQYFPYFQSLQPEDYFSTTRSDARFTLPEKSNDQYVLRYGKNLSKSPLKIMANCQLELLNRRLVDLPPQDWNEDNLSKALALFRADSTSPASLGGSRLPDHPSVVLHFTRWALTAGWSGPSIAQTMAILGRDVTLQRLANIPAVISTGASE